MVRDPRHFEIHRRWNHKNEGTPETHEKNNRDAKDILGCLQKLHNSGKIDKQQLANAESINLAASRICSDVNIGIISYEPRIDKSKNAPTSVIESIYWVRLEQSYKWWRCRVAVSVPLSSNSVVRDINKFNCIFAMLVGDQLLSVRAASVKFHVGREKALAWLVEALDLWSEAARWADDEFSDAEFEAARAALI